MKRVIFLTLLFPLNAFAFCNSHQTATDIAAVFYNPNISVAPCSQYKALNTINSIKYLEAANRNRRERDTFPKLGNAPVGFGGQNSNGYNQGWDYLNR